jgi:hypothetical protein
VLWGSATNERRIGASPQRCQAQRCPFSAQTPGNRSPQRAFSRSVGGGATVGAKPLAATSDHRPP